MRKFFFTLILLSLMLAACAEAPHSLATDLLGTWQDKQGFKIEFRNSGAGFIPGVAGSIPDSTFSYKIIDEQHVEMDAQGQKATIEFHIDGDQLTWKDAIGEVIYTRVKK